ncbi:MAG: hypothetical protein K9M80_02110 [Candidatus Marinimicrobia bacterium]|nr:hypothetical protein [Candidatus Neomarinimicrobiota bacterium]
MDNILNNLYRQTKQSILEEEFSIIDKNFNLYIKIYEKILITSTNPKNSTWLKNYNSYISNLCIELISHDLSDKALQIVRKLFRIANKKNKCSYLDFNKFFIEIFECIETENNYNKVRSLLNQIPLLDLIKNRSNCNYHKNNVSGLCRQYYLSLLKNKDISRLNKKNLINTLLNGLLEYYYFGKKYHGVLNDIIAVILKTIIDNKKENNYSEFEIIIFNDYLNKIKTRLKPYKINKLFIRIAIYFYYIIYKEESIRYKDKYVEMLNDNKDEFRDIIINASYNFWEYYEDLKNYMESWEYFEEYKAKFMIMEHVVREFFIFASTASGNFKLDNIDNNFGNVLDENEIFTFLDHNFKGDHFKSKLEDSYSNFKKAFSFVKVNKSEDELREQNKEELDALKNQLLAKYKNIKFQKIREYAKKTNTIAKNKNYFKSLIENIIENNKYLSLLSNENEQNISNKKKLLSISVPIGFIAKEYAKSNYLNEYFKSLATDTFKNGLESFILRQFFKRGFSHKKLDYRDENKIEKLYKLWSELEENQDIHIDTFISGIPYNSHFLYTESEQTINEYKKIKDKVYNFFEDDMPRWIGIDTSQVKIKFGGFNLNINKLSKNQIENILESHKRDDKYEINITNDINLLFTREEAIGYLKLSKRIISIDVKIDCIVESKPAGFIIEIKRV